ncbi:MAG: aminotransferase class V-fold PLP-dependent enzyme [Crocinitomicaceae bacterium]
MLEEYFKKFRNQIIGIDHTIETPFGTKKIVYADWTASGRTYRPIEEKMMNSVLPLVANTHTETTATGKAMTNAYQTAKDIVKNHVNANKNDVLLFTGTGMTGAISKLQRILGLKYPENPNKYMSNCAERDKNDATIPVVFITHMEHHSNHTSWLETIAKVEIIGHTDTGEVDLDDLKKRLAANKHKTLKIASVIACSNVTGRKNDYHSIAKIMHQNSGFCFVDFACSGPYENIDMHPSDNEASLDAVFLSPHKFLGGPGTAGVVVFNRALYTCEIPDQPGGGTVTFTNPWGGRFYIEDIESREDGGTPGFLQGIKTAMAIKLKEEMGVEKIMAREHEINQQLFEGFDSIPEVTVLEPNQKDRLGVFSFVVENIHYNLMVRLLNDLFGIQTRGGCACAGTYGHILLNFSQSVSEEINCTLQQGDNTSRPGWVRLSIHPTTSSEEVNSLIAAIKHIVDHISELKPLYEYDKSINDFIYNGLKAYRDIDISSWFEPARHQSEQLVRKKEKSLSPLGSIFRYITNRTKIQS